MNKLKYGEIYQINITGKNYKGIYLGEKISENRLDKKYVMVINNPSFDEKREKIDCNFSIITFEKYAFREIYNDLILRGESTIEEIPKAEREYLEELCKKFG